MIHFLQVHPLHGWEYLILFVGMFFEGTGFLLVTVFLISQKVASPLPAILSITAGAMVEQVFWYWLGQHLNKWPRLNKLLNHKLVARIDSHLSDRTLRTLVISKFAYGLHHAVLVRAGMLRLQIKKIAGASVVATGFWLLAVGSLAYGLGLSFQVLSRGVKYAELGLLSLVILFIVAEIVAAKKLEKKI